MSLWIWGPCLNTFKLSSTAYAWSYSKPIPLHSGSKNKLRSFAVHSFKSTYKSYAQTGDLVMWNTIGPFQIASRCNSGRRQLTTYRVHSKCSETFLTNTQNPQDLSVLGEWTSPPCDVNLTGRTRVGITYYYCYFNISVLCICSNVWGLLAK